MRVRFLRIYLIFIVILNVSCSIWNGQVETDALSHFNRMAILTRTQSTSGTSVPLVELMYIVFTRMPGESYRRRLRPLLLCLCDDFQALIISRMG